MGLQLGDIKDVMDTHEPSLQIKLVGTLANMLSDLEGSHIALAQLFDSCQVKVASAQKHPVSHSILLVSVVVIIVIFLLLFGLL